MEQMDVSQGSVIDDIDLTNSYYSTCNESQNTTNDSLDTSKKLVKKDIEMLIAQNSIRISTNLKGSKQKSDVWKRFSIISVDGIPQDFVVCEKCKFIYTWKSKTGTKSLNRHICESPTTSRRRGPAKPLEMKSKPIQNYFLKSVPPYAKAALNRNIAFGLAKDLHSLRTVEGTGFRHLAQALINFGATYGRQRVDDVLQHRTTLRNSHIPEMSDETREKYRKFFVTLPRNYKFAFSKDLWTEKWQKRNFLSLSCHIIDDDWNLKEIMLGLDEMIDGKHTGDVREKCLQILKLYFDETRAENIIKSSYSVTDGGSNMMKVFCKHLPCECHKLNLFAEWILNEKKLPDEAKILARAAKGKPYSPIKLFNLQTRCPTIYKSLKGVRNVVTYFKQSHLNAILPSTLKQAVETRWDSSLHMLESFVKVKDEVETLLLRQHKLEKIKDIEYNLLDELIIFLRPIRECSKRLSGDKYPTINLVAVSYAELAESIEKFEAKSMEMELLVANAKLCFEKYIVTSSLHYMTCMLDPR